MAILSDPDAHLTVFPPTDEAFAALPSSLVDFLLDNPCSLRDVILYHAVPEERSIQRLARHTVNDTALGEPLLVKRGHGDFFANDSRVLARNLRASNGKADVIDAVLIPPSLRMPPGPTEVSNVVDLLVLDGRFTTLLFLLSNTSAGDESNPELALADLAASLEGFTLLAPTDEAFAKLFAKVDPATLSEEEVRGILLYHLILDELTLGRLILERKVETVLGPDVEVKLRRKGAFINRPKLVNPNLQAPNAIVQSIDHVLMPPAPKDDDDSD